MDKKETNKNSVSETKELKKDSVSKTKELKKDSVSKTKESKKVPANSKPISDKDMTVLKVGKVKTPVEKTKNKSTKSFSGVKKWYDVSIFSVKSSYEKSVNSAKISYEKSTVKNLSDSVEKDVKQLVLGLIAGLTILSLIIAQLVTQNDSKGSNMVVNLMLGGAFGFVLARGAFGFAGAFRNPIQKKDYSLSKGVVKFLGITTVLVAIVGMIQMSFGTDPFAFGTGIIGTNGSGQMSFMFVIGGLLFGIGMIMAGGCASGTLQDIGVGAVGAVLALFGWMFGVFVGFMVGPIMATTWMGESWSYNFFMEIGIIGGLAVNLILIGLVYLLLITLEKKFGKKPTEKTVLEIETENEKAYIAEKVSFVSNKKANRVYFNLFQKKWTMSLTVILLSFIAILSLSKTGIWGVSATYGYWAAWIIEGFGVDVASINLTGEIGHEIGSGFNEAIFNDGFWNHTESMYNISIILGSTLAIALAGKFNLDYKMKPKNIVILITGGFIMGFGTRLSGGCNIGALVDPIVTGQLTGYAFGILLTAGAWIGVKFMSVTKSL